MIKIHSFTEIHRQAQKSGILRDANMIRENRNPLTGLRNAEQFTTGELQDMNYHFFNDREKLNAALLERYYKLVDEFSLNKVAIITPMKSHGVNSTEKFNNKIQDKILSSEPIKLASQKRQIKRGAKVIQKVNNYEKDVVNGEIGFLTDINDIDKEFTVSYPKKEIVYDRTEFNQIYLAYALTVHSYQGSQSDHVLISIDYSHYTLLDACLLYTAITRAVKSCWIFAERRAFNYAVRENKNRNRTTFLSQIIQNHNEIS